MIEKKYILSLLFIFCCVFAKAQFVGDVAGIEAYIYEHKSVQVALEARTLASKLCLEMHKQAKKKSKDMKNAADSLDQYLGCINVMNAVLSSLQTGFSVYNTYTTVKDYMPKYLSVINAYVDFVTKQKKIYASDRMIIDIGNTCYANISDHVERIYYLATSLASSLKFQSAYQLNLDIQSINAELVAIQTEIRRLYSQTYTYVNLRLKCFKSCLYETFSSEQQKKLILSNRALKRWCNSGFRAIGLSDRYE